MIFPGAPSALRGYRLQHLYSLFRILSDDEQGRAFQLEGSEDLEIFNEVGQLIEAIQVKARSTSALTPSALTTTTGASFFARAVERLKRDPASVQRVVSFGEIGPTLAVLGAGSDGASSDQRVVVERAGVPPELVERFIAAFEVEQVSEEAIEGDVLKRLADTVTGCDPGVAFLYLSGWMFRQMEERRLLTAADVRARLLAVGRFIAEAHAHAVEWFTTIVPLEERVIDGVRREQLARDFYEGVSARFEHILAGVDVERPERTNAIGVAFEKTNVVVVHGASGQGKTALACRYLLSAAPAAWRFLIREVQDIPHARRVALALRSHADSIGVPMIVWLDVTPQDTAWTRLVEELEALSNMRVLITIREEDWTRARNAGATLRHGDVGLSLDEPEGRRIFDGLQRYRVSEEFLDFDEAWRRFGGHGPLMEFTYLVTRGDALKARLDQQVRRLREDVRLGRMSGAEIELLRRVAVATTTGGRVRLAIILGDLALPDPKSSLDIFEREYLLRVSPDGTHAEGLHALRSAIVAELLTSDSAFDPSWLDTAIAVLPSVDERDLEPFLLALFSQLIEEEEFRRVFVVMRPRSWAGAAAVVRALLWRGIHAYTRENTALIKEIIQQKTGEFPLMVLDPAGLETFVPSFRGLLEGIFGVSPELRTYYDELRRRKPSNARVTSDAFLWLRDAPDFVDPTSPSDWKGVSEVLFWLAASGWASKERARTVIEALAGVQADVTLEDAADVLFALSFWNQADLPGELKTIRDRLLDRFQVELGVIAIVHDADGVTAHYIVAPDESDLHRQTTRRLDLMRRLLPEEKGFGAQAYGHLFGSDLFPHDPSRKRGVPSDGFPIPWVTRLVQLFTFVVGSRVRGRSWGEYAETILKMRRAIVMLASATIIALRKYFSRDKPRSIFELGVEGVAWYALSERLKDLPDLPASAVDDWGIEIAEKSSVRSVERRSVHAPWTETLGKFANGFQYFLEMSTPYFLANCHIGRPNARGKNAIATALKDTKHQSHGATDRLVEVLQLLRTFQTEFRARFVRFAEGGDLSKLEADECDRLWALWAIWFQFADRPRQYLSDARRESLAEVSEVLARRRRDLTRRLTSVAEANAIIHHERTWPNTGHGLWLTMDVAESAKVTGARDATFAALIEALRPPADFHALDRYALDLAWRDVYVIPLVRGKSLRRSAWRFRIATLPQPGQELDASQFIDQPVDEDLWRELHIGVWPASLGGVARRLYAEFSAVALLLTLYGQVENTPPPEKVGASVLMTHWRRVHAAILEHATRAASALAECPTTLFSDGETSLKVLKQYGARIISDLACMDPFAFDRQRELSTEVTKLVNGTLGVLVDAAIDAELA